MYDYTKCYSLVQVLDWSAPLPLSLQYNGLDFGPVFYKGQIIKYCAKDDFGLRHTIYSNKYEIENSLHKAYSVLKGSYGNHSSFNFQQAREIILHLSKCYNLSLNKTYIKKLELGLNIEVDNNPMDYIKKLRSVKFTKVPEHMRKLNRNYGKKIVFSQFCIKLYDKTYQTYNEYRQRIDKNTIRFELAYNNITSIKQYAATLGHLIEQDNYEALTEELNRRFMSLSFHTAYNLDVLTPREIDVYYAGLNKSYWDYLKKINKHTAATKRRKYEMIMKKIEPRNSDELLLEFRLKFKKRIY